MAHITILVCFVLVFAAGCILGFASKTAYKLIGTLRVDNSIPEDGPQLFLELEKDIQTIKKHDYVTLRVNLSNYISQK